VRSQGITTSESKLIKLIEKGTLKPVRRNLTMIKTDSPRA
jgi:hypothetical protein